jgi:hypothetical protein
MGFNLLAFAGGAASALGEKIDTAEKEAKTFAMASTKNMYDKYSKVLEENERMAKEAADEIAFIKASTGNMLNGKTFSAEQYSQLAMSPVTRKMFVSAINKGDVDFSNLDPDQIVKLVTNNNPNTGREYLQQAATLNKTYETEMTKRNTEKQMGFFDRFGESAGKATAQKTAMALGTTVEQMQETINTKRPEATAAFDLSSFKARKTSAELADQAKVRAFEAKKAGNLKAEQDALIDYGVLQAYIAKPKTEKEKLEEDKAKLINIIVKGGKEGAAAQKQLDAYVAIEVRENRQKNVKDVKNDAPSLGSINSFVRDAAARGVIANFGNNKGLVRNVLPDGTMTAEYSGDPTLPIALDIDEVRKKSALRALSFYEKQYPNNIDIKAIRESWEKITPAEPLPQPAPGAPAKPALPVIPAKTAPVANPVPPPKFQEGKIYTDAKGNKAKYVNGKWEPQ